MKKGKIIVLSVLLVIVIAGFSVLGYLKIPRTFGLALPNSEVISVSRQIFHNDNFIFPEDTPDYEVELKGEEKEAFIKDLYKVKYKRVFGYEGYKMSFKNRNFHYKIVYEDVTVYVGKVRMTYCTEDSQKYIKYLPQEDFSNLDKYFIERVF